MGDVVEQVEHLLAVHNVLGEGPVWDTQEQVLYWVDIEGHEYLRYLPQLDDVERIAVGARIVSLQDGSSAPVAVSHNNGRLLLAPRPPPGELDRWRRRSPGRPHRGPRGLQLEGAMGRRHDRALRPVGGEGARAASTGAVPDELLLRRTPPQRALRHLRQPARPTGEA